MVDSNYRKKATELVRKAQQRGLVKKYTDFCQTKDAKKYALSKEIITMDHIESRQKKYGANVYEYGYKNI